MGVLPYPQAKHEESDCVQRHDGSKTSSHFGLPKMRRMRANTEGNGWAEWHAVTK